ncbi:MAG: thiamine-phosphate kinase [Pelagibacterales bacterium]|nr:thiamine-phosphate kinase [Pelagibacterales bacterium]
MPKNLEEFSLIKKFFKPLTNNSKSSQNLSDDVAKISLDPNKELVISKDLMVENVHFLESDGAFKIASKLLLSNLSDIASSGATPLYYTLGFSKNNKTNLKFVKDFCDGLKSVQDQFKLTLIGGDTVKSKQLFFSVTIFGVIEKNKILSRLNAKNEDLIFVSGTIGDAFLGLNQNKITKFKTLDDKEKNYLLNRHFFPNPRIKLGKELLENNLSQCACDVSDGLFADLKNICESSNLDAEIYLDKIPLSKAAKNLIQKDKSINVQDLSSAGEDYELIFTVKKQNQNKILSLAKKLNLNLTCIGSMKKTTNKKPKIILFGDNNKKIKIKKYGYEH